MSPPSYSHLTVWKKVCRIFFALRFKNFIPKYISACLCRINEGLENFLLLYLLHNSLRGRSDKGKEGNESMEWKGGENP